MSEKQRRIIEYFRNPDISNLIILLALAYLAWKRLSPDNDTIKDTMLFYPTGYRLWTQFLVFLDQNPIAFVAWVSITFAGVSWLLFIGARRQDRHFLFVWLVFVLLFSSTRQAPAYLLLALAIMLHKYEWSYVLVVPMVLIKEHAGLVYIIYLIAVKKYKEAVLVAVLWGGTYLSIRLIIGPLDFFIPDDLSLVVTTPILTLHPYIVRLTLLKWLWIFIEFGLCIIFLKDRSEVLMILLNLPIIVVFGLFYEFQLWLMVIVAIVYKRRIGVEYTNYPNGVSKDVA